MSATFASDGTFIPDAPPKDPDSNIDYGVNWSSWLQDGEIIVASEWIVPDGLIGGFESFSDSNAAIFLTGGTVGITYTLTNRITTNQNRIEDRSMLIECKQK